ncbi:MAG: hypothetical protein GX175_07070 [Halanaerobiaceae bacterium]|nr:hypothetical protein [Halanaerobiaceae bacterium]
MNCQRCNIRKATVHLTKIVNNEKTEAYLCEECARETGQLPFSGGNPFAFQNLLQGILSPELDSFEQYQQKLECDKCGLSYRDFTQKGLFGCANCYDTFSEQIEPIFKRVHGNTLHNGKVPGRRGGTLRIKREIEELREEMQRAVFCEDFEKAAEIRDKIKELEEKEKKQKQG